MIERNTKQSGAFLALTVLLGTGCSFYARKPDDYRKAVREVLDTRHHQVESCYKSELQSDEHAKGKVVVKFDVEPKTGNFTQLSVDEGKSDAPKPLQQCVLSSLEGLKLDPADQRKGQATFEWDFTR